MKIVIISAAYPFRGGIAHFTQMLYKEFVKHNDVSIITFMRQYPSFLFPGKTQYEPSKPGDAPPTEEMIDSINPLNWIKIGKKIKSMEADLVIFNFWMPYFGPCFGKIAQIIKKNRRSKILIIPHNVIPHDPKPGDRIFTKYFFKKADYFVPMAEGVKNDLLKIIPGAEFTLLFHPVYSNFGKAVNKAEARKYLNLDEGPVVLFFGFIRKYKGLDTLIEAAALLKDKLPLTVLAAGEFYEDKQPYLDMIEKYRLREIVKLYSDFIPNDDVKYYFSAADAVILPYKSATQSGILQIANNFEKPVIAADVGGMGEFVKNDVNGFLVEKNNPGKLAEAILDFYSKAKEPEFSANVKKEREKYSWQNFADGIIELVKDK